MTTYTPMQPGDEMVQIYEDLTAEETLHSILTHNGEITIHNPKTGQHRTFRIRTQKADAKFAPGQRILSMLVGSDNEHSYQGFAFVSDSGVHIWSKKRTPFYTTVADMLTDPEKWTEKHAVEYLFDTTCRVCNRKLTTPESIESGIGPVCAGR